MAAGEGVSTRSVLLDEYERLTFEIQLNQAILGRGFSSPPSVNAAQTAGRGRAPHVAGREGSEEVVDIFPQCRVPTRAKGGGGGSSGSYWQHPTRCPGYEGFQPIQQRLRVNAPGGSVAPVELDLPLPPLIQLPMDLQTFVPKISDSPDVDLLHST